jgi:Fe-Mn family superoxide dismutase
MTAPYALPDLAYDYGALEPHISGEIMELHHSKHHAKYVAGANTALEQMAEARDAGELASVNLLQKNLAFNLSGHVNHTVFWQNLSPDGGDVPDGELGAAVGDAFGSFDGFRSHFSAAASGVQGSGWAILAWEPVGARLVIEQLYDHQGNMATGAQPLLLLDMWEHAYYLQYRNTKDDYIAAFWHVADWADVTERFAAARSVRVG